ncbi:unnamed protein product [Cochlearia groenlandica]
MENIEEAQGIGVERRICDHDEPITNVTNMGIRPPFCVVPNWEIRRQGGSMVEECSDLNHNHAARMQKEILGQVLVHSKDGQIRSDIATFKQGSDERKDYEREIGRDPRYNELHDFITNTLSRKRTPIYSTRGRGECYGDGLEFAKEDFEEVNYAQGCEQRDTQATTW